MLNIKYSVNCNHWNLEKKCSVIFLGYIMFTYLGWFMRYDEIIIDKQEQIIILCGVATRNEF